MKYLVKGTFIDTPSYDKLRIRSGFLLVENGKVVSLMDSTKNEENLPVFDYSNKIIIPGLIDLHLHAPQYNFAGSAMDLELLDWLNKYTFPEEAKFNDMDYATRTYKLLVNELVNSVTTRACIFSSIHNESTLKLMDMLEEAKFISYVGKVSMDRNSPSYYVEKDGVTKTQEFINDSIDKGYKFVKPIITPRFTPAVSDEYMNELGLLAKKFNLPVQSHLSENQKEIEMVKELRPSDKNYAESYYKYALFGNNQKTIMAHCIHCDNDELKMIKDNGVFIAHCPTSNVNVIAGICPSAMLLRNDYNIGLGSDIAGGHTLNLLEVMRTAIQSSKNRYKLISDEYKPLSISEALYMATAGGGKFFGDVGLFEKGYEFDAVIFDDSSLSTPREYSFQERFERLIYLDAAKIVAKFIFGNKII